MQLCTLRPRQTGKPECFNFDYRIEGCHESCLTSNKMDLRFLKYSSFSMVSSFDDATTSRRGWSDYSQNCKVQIYSSESKINFNTD